MTGDGPEGGEVVASDMFFGLAAILIVLMCLMSQHLRAALTEATGAEATELQAAAQGSGRALVLAGAEGVALVAPSGTVEEVPLAAMLDGRLTAWAAANPDIWVVLQANARDSAFLLDTALARAGVERIRRIRLDGPCPAPRFTERGVSCGG